MLVWGLAAAVGLAAAQEGADGARAVIYLPADSVAAAFARGVPLLERENYKVHASRRDAAGEAEVHTHDTDIVHVLTGEATFVTGGTVVGARNTGPEEIRGRSVEGGETRRIRAGDVIVVPSGTSHWFKEVPAPMTYYVVKVRVAGGGR
jgi:quercetin dioxygenase-like cupin family protein